VQDVLGIREEVVELRQLAIGDVRLVPSRDRWNPVAAVVVADVALPPGISPVRTTLRLPLPNLYGFAASVSVAFVPAPLTLGRDGRPVPFCLPLAAGAVGAHREYLVDLREHRDDLAGAHYLCMTPTTDPRAPFRHSSMAAFVVALLEYLRRPSPAVRRDLSLARELWEETGDAWWLIRIGHLHDGLGETEAATATFAAGSEQFPGRPEFGALLERARSRYAAGGSSAAARQRAS
jgi:hypothetical protein